MDDEWTDADVVDYNCHDSDVRLLRGIDQSHPVWRTRAAKIANGDYERLPGRVSIAKAWFGIPVTPPASRLHADT
jgi:hypothetical protein